MMFFNARRAIEALDREIEMLDRINKVRGELLIEIGRLARAAGLERRETPATIEYVPLSHEQETDAPQGK